MMHRKISGYKRS